DIEGHGAGRRAVEGDLGVDAADAPSGCVGDHEVVGAFRVVDAVGELDGGAVHGGAGLVVEDTAAGVQRELGATVRNGAGGLRACGLAGGHRIVGAQECLGRQGGSHAYREGGLAHVRSTPQKVELWVGTTQR